MAVQLPAETHDTELTRACGGPAGRDAWTPVAQVPAVSVSSSPCCFPELSYRPTAVQLPAEAHDTDARETAGLEPGSSTTPAGRTAPAAVNVSPPRRSREPPPSSPRPARPHRPPPPPCPPRGGS